MRFDVHVDKTTIGGATEKQFKYVGAITFKQEKARVKVNIDDDTIDMPSLIVNGDASFSERLEGIEEVKELTHAYARKLRDENGEEILEAMFEKLEKKAMAKNPDKAGKGRWI